MSPVSPVFHTEATVSIGLKNVLRVGTFILFGTTWKGRCYIPEQSSDPYPVHKGEQK